MPKYWLIKSEPHAYSIDDLANEKNETTSWEGVRNYQARNFMRDDMKKGDLVLFYHSNAKPPGVVGTAKVVSESYVDHFAFDTNSKYFDPKSKRDSPRWFMVDVKLVKKFKAVVGLPEIKATKSLAKMVLVNNSRLSVQPVTKKEFDTILKMAESK
jgi:predicted RNA-binding protein with PUA-like domain